MGPTDFDALAKRLFDAPIHASDGSHSARLLRVAENIRSQAQRDSSDDRLLHLMSRIGVLCRGLAKDVRSGHTSVEEATTILDQLADIGEFSFDQWLRCPDNESTASET